MLKTCYFVCLSYLLIVTDVVRSETDYMFNYNVGGWLKLYSTPKAWEEAVLRCYNDGAVLASPLNKELTHALRSQMILFGVNGHIFLGTHDLYSKGFFVSVEGVPLSDMDIRWGSHGKRADTGDCLTMSSDGSALFSSCKDSLPFFCFKKPDNQTINECGTFDNEYQLDRRTGSCYKVHRGKQTWARAYGICASEGAHLVVLNNAEEAIIINTMFPENVDQFYRFHIGIGAWGKERVWATIDGQRIEDVYNNWHPGQPDNLDGIQNRGAFLKNGYLDDIGLEELEFVCEKSPKSKRSEALPPASKGVLTVKFDLTGKPLSDMDISWDSHGNGLDTGDCFTISVDGSAYYSSCKDPLPVKYNKKLDSQIVSEYGTNDNDLVRYETDYEIKSEVGSLLKLHSTPAAWEEAFLRCNKDGAVLASPLNKELAQAIRTLITNLGVSSDIYLGIHDSYSRGQFTSVEGVPLSDMDIRWGSRNGVDSADCLTMSVDGNAYYSSCKDPLPFICYKKLDNQITNECGTLNTDNVLSKPEYSFNFEAGGWEGAFARCHDEEYHFNQQTCKCYKVHLEEQTWTRAYEICASEGSHLVILNNEEEADIVKGMFPVNGGTQFHIGLRAWSDERIWTAIHGERINDVYNHWNASQPDNWCGTQDRASILRNGYLDDVQPWTVAMFVCEASPPCRSLCGGSNKSGTKKKKS